MIVYGTLLVEGQIRDEGNTVFEPVYSDTQGGTRQRGLMPCMCHYGLGPSKL